jgi:hypothetical protein
MSFENPLLFVRSMKGAPASVLLALLLTRHPMTNRELQRWTGYSEESVRMATDLLMDVGWVSALGPRGPWTLGGGRQLPLMQGPPLEIQSSVPSSMIENDAWPTDEANPEESEDMEDERVVRTLHALYDAGITEPTAGRLAHLPHVSPEYISAHVEQANAQGYTLGTAIYRIEHGWPLPVNKPVLTVEERIKRFLSDR